MREFNPANIKDENTKQVIREINSENKRRDATFKVINEYLFLYKIKSGSTQANAGAAANELWKTDSHATLPDNVIMIGV